MSFRSQTSSFVLRIMLAAVVMIAGPLSVWAGHFNFRGNNVGGVKIDAEGVLAQPDLESRKLYLQHLKQDLKAAEGDLARPVELRMVSLRGLEAALADAQTNNLGRIPDEVRFLAGLQRIQYVFVYPEENDIVLAGPGEGWKIRDEDAMVVGVTTGRPVLQLDDLLVAFRAIGKLHEKNISCSIDPTPEGRRNYEAFMARQKTFSPAALTGIEKALGPQKITITGVPGDSHLARVLVAADYRMKRIAMNLDPTPLKQLPSFLHMLESKNQVPTNVMPRWWLACHYEPLAKSEDGLAWELRGQGVKCLTEDDLVNADGTTTATGKANPVAQKWADTMTKHYDELAVKDAVFGELRNVMDLCVIAALIQKEDLLAKAGLALPTLLGEKSELTYEPWNTPKTVATQCSVLKVGRNFAITASGGVEVTSWDVASKSEVLASVKELRASRKAPAGKNWWAN